MPAAVQTVYGLSVVVTRLHESHQVSVYGATESWYKPVKRWDSMQKYSPDARSGYELGSFAGTYGSADGRFAMSGVGPNGNAEMIAT